MDNLQIFNSEEFGAVRTVTIENEPWFVGKDVATILGYKDTSDAMKRHVDEDDKGVGEIPTPGGKQNMKVINESGLYSLILSSKLPSAKKFKRWITSEVLPTIRKHGVYMTDDVLEQAVFNPDFMIGLLTKLKEEQEQRKLLQKENQKLAIKIEKDKSKVDYVDTILNSKNTMTITQIAKDYDLSGRELNKILHNEKIQYKCGNQWLLYAKHIGKGYTKSNTFVDDFGGTRVNTKWTQKGRLMIHELLTKLGYVAIMDRI